MGSAFFIYYIRTMLRVYSLCVVELFFTAQTCEYKSAAKISFSRIVKASAFKSAEASASFEMRGMEDDFFIVFKIIRR